MMKPVPDDLLDRIYEAAVVADRWRHVLDDLSRIAGAEGGVAFAVHTGGAAWTASEPLESGMQRFIAQGWHLRNSRLHAGRARGFLSRFATEADLFEPGAWERDPLYVDFFYPEGYGWSVGCALALPEGDTVTISLERARGNGPVPTEVVETLDGLLPHIARSLVLAGRLSFARLKDSLATLERMGFPAAAVDRTMRVVAANDAFSRTPSDFVFRGLGRLAHGDERIRRLISEAVEQVADGASLRSIPLPATLASARTLAHVIPVRRDARDLFARADALIVIGRVPAARELDRALVRVLFDMTPAEADVACAIARGLSIREIAAQSGKGVETVRSQVKAALARAGCRSQIDLVRVLNGLPMADGA